MEPVARPLLVTLAVPARVQRALDTLRRAHYPPEHNRVPAHLSLFRHLPGTQAPALLSALRTEAASTRVFPLDLGPVTAMGPALVLPARSDALIALHERLSGRFQPLLVPQDRGPFHPHVTLANKLDPATLSATRRALETANPRFSTQAEGLFLWRFDEDRPTNPWALLVRLGFRR
jgi:2'-5' RNA ligase